MEPIRSTVCFCAMLLVGCGIANYQQGPKPTHLVTFYSIPPAATVTLGGRVIGQTPVTVPVVANKEKTLRTGVATLENISIRWQSGAQIQNTQVSFGIYIAELDKNSLLRGQKVFQVSK